MEKKKIEYNITDLSVQELQAWVHVLSGWQGNLAQQGTQWYLLG